MSTPSALVHELRWVHRGAVPDEVLVWFDEHPYGRRCVTGSHSAAHHLRGLAADLDVLVPLAAGEGPDSAFTAARRAEVEVLAGPRVPVLFGPGRAGWAQRWQREGLSRAPLRRLVATRRVATRRAAASPERSRRSVAADWVLVEMERRQRGALRLDTFHVHGPQGVTSLWSPAVELPSVASAAALGLVARRLLADFPLPHCLGPRAVGSLAAWLALADPERVTPTATTA